MSTHPLHRTPSTTSRRSSSSTGFRLVDPDPETGSIYSIYKQKIDKMFESDSSEKNNVQVRIERMFSDVAVEEGIQEDLGQQGSHVFSVDYLGSVGLGEKVTSLTGLQNPLKELYFGYKKSVRHKKTLTGKLEISAAGLKVRYQGDKGDLEQLNPFPTIAVWSAVKFVLHNSPNISFAFLPLITDPDNLDKQTLFQLLDPSDSKFIVNQAHAPLFAVVMRKIGLQRQLECHGFICQTSEDAIVIAATLYKSLMNHMKNRPQKPRTRGGVGCLSVSSSTFADSINNIPVRPPRKKRSTSGSVSSEKTPKKSIKTRKAPTVPVSNPPPPLGPPQKAPQFNPDEIVPYEEPNTVQTPNESQINDNSELKRTRSVRRRSEDSILVKSGDFSGDILTKVTIPRSGSFLNAGGLTRYKSKINRNGLTSGGSPLGFSELFAEFRLQENLHSLDEILAAIVKPEGMSFNDLKPIYKEFLLKLAVTLTKDELFQRAKCIIRRKKRKNRKVKGIGVHKLKKVFRKSFRLKISRKLQKKKLKTLNNTSTAKSVQTNVESSISTSSYDTRQFQPKKQIDRRRNNDSRDSKARNRRDRMSTSEDSDFFTMKRRKDKRSPSQQNRNSSSGYVSCSECSYDSDTCTCVSADKCYCSLGNRFNKLKDPKSRRPQTASSCRSCRTFDDRCYCSLDPALHTLTWCGCETDTCTESEKCYCQSGKGSKVFEEFKKKDSKEVRKTKKSMKKPQKFDPKNRIFEELERKGFFPSPDDRINPNPGVKTSKKYRKNTEPHLPPNKSYLHSQRVQNNNFSPPDCIECLNNSQMTPGGTIFEQLQKRGFIPSGEDPTTPPNERKLCKKNSNTRSTKSVEYHHNPTEKYYEKLQNYYEDDFDVLQGQTNVRRKCISENDLIQMQLYNREVYGRALSETGPRNVVQNSVRSFKSFNGNNRRVTTGTTLQKSIPPTSSTEALSVKKSAEIAALFTDLKLSQTTDITHIIPTQFPANSLNSHQFPLSSSQFQRPRQFHNDKKAIVTPYKHISNNGKMVQNTLYQTRNYNNKNNKNGLYSAKNGLYTIQSQSDSSCSDGQLKAKKTVGNFENTLGYLP